MGWARRIQNAEPPGDAYAPDPGAAITKAALRAALLARGWKPEASSYLLCFLVVLRFRDGNRLTHFADFEAREAPDENIFAQFADLAGDQLMDGDALLLHERLIHETNLFVEFGHFAFHDFLDYVGGLAAGGCLGAVDFFFFLVGFRRDVFFANEFRIRRRNVHSDIFHQVFEVVGAGNEIALAVDFHQHADLASGVDVAGDSAFAGNARGLLGGGVDALLAQMVHGGVFIAFAGFERFFAIHHGRAGALA